MNTATRTFDTPLNEGRRLHGTLRVSFSYGKKTELTRIRLIPAGREQESPVDITYLVETFCQPLCDTLIEMADDLISKDEPDYTMQQQDNY